MKARILNRTIELDEHQVHGGVGGGALSATRSTTGYPTARNVSGVENSREPVSNPAHAPLVRGSAMPTQASTDTVSEGGARGPRRRLVPEPAQGMECIHPSPVVRQDRS